MRSHCNILFLGKTLVHRKLVQAAFEQPVRLKYALWCNHHLISEGISEAEVRQQCGPPVQVDEAIEYWVMGDRYGHPLARPYRVSIPPPYLPYQTIVSFRRACLTTKKFGLYN